MLTSALSMSNTRLLDGASRVYPRDGAGMGGDRWVERRRNGRPGDSPTDALTRLPAVVVLEHIPVPSLAIAREGIILFANTALPTWWVTGRTG